MGDTREYLENAFPDEPEQWGGSADDVFPRPTRVVYGSDEDDPNDLTNIFRPGPETTDGSFGSYWLDLKHHPGERAPIDLLMRFTNNAETILRASIEDPSNAIYRRYLMKAFDLIETANLILYDIHRMHEEESESAAAKALERGRLI